MSAYLIVAVAPFLIFNVPCPSMPIDTFLPVELEFGPCMLSMPLLILVKSEYRLAPFLTFNVPWLFSPMFRRSAIIFEFASCKLTMPLAVVDSLNEIEK